MNFYAETLVREVLAMEKELENGIDSQGIFPILSRIQLEIDGIVGERSETEKLSKMP
ncbi:hypothetical protein D3C71_1782770 [compost metagenome]